jgi:hypothetical protein
MINADNISEHVVDGITVKVFHLPSGAYCAIIVSEDAVFQATFNEELKPVTVADHLQHLEHYKLPVGTPTPEMLTVMRTATMRHMQANTKSH